MLENMYTIQDVQLEEMVNDGWCFLWLFPTYILYLYYIISIFYIYIYIDTHTHIYMITHKFTYTNTCIYIYMYLTIYLHTYTHIGIDIDIDNAHTCIWICVRCLCAWFVCKRLDSRYRYREEFASFMVRWGSGEMLVKSETTLRTLASDI